MQNAIEHPVEAKRRARKGAKLARELLNLKGTGSAVLDAYRAILSRVREPAWGSSSETPTIDESAPMIENLANPPTSS
jgi:hypothetical protein